MQKGFWNDLKTPIIGLSPMDGVTDIAFRYINDIIGHPSLLMTEFVSVEGIHAGAVKVMSAFLYHKTNTPTIAQIFGFTPSMFYQAAIILSEMGFDGIDINMGCPDSHIAKKGGGAGLIRTPDIARKIIQETKRGTKDWANGMTIQESGLPDSIIEYVLEFKKRVGVDAERRELPISVKTRIGYDAIVTTDWISILLEEEPANITLHGRTLKQLYTGLANWDEIAKAAELAHKTNTSLIGNGDVHSRAEALEKVATYKTDGVFIGRASFGNPWVFTGEDVSPQKRLQTALLHVEAFMKLSPEFYFPSMRKHLAWYTRGFENSGEVRMKFMQTKTADEVRAIVEDTLKNYF